MNLSSENTFWQDDVRDGQNLYSVDHAPIEYGMVKFVLGEIEHAGEEGIATLVEDERGDGILRVADEICDLLETDDTFDHNFVTGFAFATHAFRGHFTRLHSSEKELEAQGEVWTALRDVPLTELLPVLDLKELPPDIRMQTIKHLAPKSKEEHSEAVDGLVKALKTLGVRDERINTIKTGFGVGVIILDRIWKSFLESGADAILDKVPQGDEFDMKLAEMLGKSVVEDGLKDDKKPDDEQ